VVDGDTIELSDGSKVRLIGIDTPESVDPRRPVECLGKEASDHTASLLPPGTGVRLEYDAQREDRYGRTLAYVYRTDDGLFVNAAIARDGFAQQLTIPPNVAKADEIAVAVDEARAEGRGLWGVVCADVDPSGPSSTTVDGGSACDAAYPDVCIPPGPPAGADLDCSDVTYRRFPVSPPDPHSFDADGNGIGCEQT
jgi:micrococcal nuclease